MAFVRTKTIHGRKYQYLVQNYREGEKTRQRVLRYLGPVNPVHERKSHTYEDPIVRPVNPGHSVPRAANKTRLF